MPIYVATCRRHGQFESLARLIRVPREEAQLACPTCGKFFPLDPTAPGVRFRGDGFQTPRPQPKAADSGSSAKLKQERY